MQLVRTAKEIRNAGKKICAAIGFFDGVHLGHQQIIRQTIDDARQQDGLSVAITFDRHPSSIVAPDRIPPLIYTTSQRLHTIEELGVDAILILTFDRELSTIPGDAFVRQLASDLGRLVSISVGRNFCFGNKRSGNVSLLEQLGKALAFQVHGHASVALGGKTVSSTRIREAIAAGHLDLAAQMLGRSYSIRSKVLRGDQLGAKIGYPTANLQIDGLCLPPNGVYAAKIFAAGKSWRGVMNIGRRPTLGLESPPLRLEVNLFDFAGDLYEQEIEVTFGRKLREEKKFESLDALKAQIAADAQQARDWFS